MLCFDYQTADPFRSCCASVRGEAHLPDCNRKREHLMVAGAEERVRVGRLRAKPTEDWRPADRVVGAITYWDAATDPAGTVGIPEATGYPSSDGEQRQEFEDVGEEDLELARLVRRLRAIGWGVLLLPLGGCGMWQARHALHLEAHPAAAWGQIATVLMAIVGIAVIAWDLLGTDDEASLARFVG